MDTSVQIAKKALSDHALKLADMEEHISRKNFRLVWFPEGAEGRHPEEFLEGWLTEHLPPDAFTTRFAIERAHRIPTSAPPKGGILQPMIAKILHFRDLENILKGARNGPELEFNGYRISIYPDFSAATQTAGQRSASEKTP